MNVKIVTEGAQFPEKEYINGIFVAVLQKLSTYHWIQSLHGRVHICLAVMVHIWREKHLYMYINRRGGVGGGGSLVIH